MKTLVIAEKPSVGRDLARVLKCRQKGDGCLIGDEYIVTWAIGHLVTLNDAEDYDPSHKKWRRDSLPIIPETMHLKAIPRGKKQLNILKKLMNSRDTGLIICATDSGREGELIFRYIYQWAACRKPVKRLWISSLTDAAISDGLKNIKDGREYDNLFASAKCRAEADWLVGINATRAFTINRGELLPMGRVQTPTLAMLVMRHREIVAFVPEDYWEVHGEFLTEKDEVYKACWQDEKGVSRLGDKERASEIAAKVKKRRGVVESAKTEEKRRHPPQLFDLTELQRECNRKLGFSADKTLKLAQSLYEKHKLITYPRTDSRYLTTDIAPKLGGIVKTITAPEYKPFSDYLQALPQLPLSPRIVNDAKVSDHHAIIPTGGKKPLSALTADERTVYDRVLRNFLGAFHPAHVFDVTTVITRVEGEAFRSQGKVEKQAGWTTLYAHEKNPKAEKNEFEDLPLLSVGDIVTTKSAKVVQKKTQPPKPHTEATLLSAMENAGRLVEDESLKEAMKSSGLGTPSTRAAIIEKLISVGYVVRAKKNLSPTEKGIRLIEIVPPELRQPETTGKWEKALARIAEGKMDEKRFMESIKRYVVYLVEEGLR